MIVRCEICGKIGEMADLWDEGADIIEKLAYRTPLVICDNCIREYFLKKEE